MRCSRSFEQINNRGFKWTKNDQNHDHNHHYFQKVKNISKKLNDLQHLQIEKKSNRETGNGMI